MKSNLRRSTRRTTRYSADECTLGYQEENQEISETTKKSSSRKICRNVETKANEVTESTKPHSPSSSTKAMESALKTKIDVTGRHFASDENGCELDAESGLARKRNPKESRKMKRKSPEGKKKEDNYEDGCDSDSMGSKCDNTPVAKKRVKAPSHHVLTVKDDIPKLWDVSNVPESSYPMKIASWNVAGLRSVLTSSPSILVDLVRKHDLDVLCLQETKLQEQHVQDPKFNFSIDGYTGYFSCSTVRKGYSGTCVYVRDVIADRTKKNKQQKTMDQFFGNTLKSKEIKTSDCQTHNKSKFLLDEKLRVPQHVTYKIGFDKHDAEGRVVVLDFPTFTMCNVYVPNSGQGLKRLQYRLEEWDKDFLSFIQKKKSERGVPVMWLGDLNVARHMEVWNEGAKHLPKQAGVTPEERASFSAQLDAGFVDAFRHFHPTASGHYSYWSTRAGNRPSNKGLRLDYFICDQAFFEDSSLVVPRDSYMLSDQEGSDHCPVVLELELRAV